MKKVAKEISEDLFGDFIKTVTNLVDNYKKYEELTAEEEAHIVFESQALLFWLVKTDYVFPRIIHVLVIENIHFLYYDYLSATGITDNKISVFNNQLSNRYVLYDKAIEDKFDPEKIGNIYQDLRNNTEHKTSNNADGLIDALAIFSHYKEAVRKYHDYHNNN